MTVRHARTRLGNGRVGNPARRAEAEAESGTGWYAVVARVGLLAKGVSFGIVGVLAIGVAIGSGGKATSRQGALQTLAQHGYGTVLLILLAIGFAAYALWRIVQAIAERKDEDDAKGAAKKWGKRAGYVGRAVIYGGLTYSTIRILTGSGQQQSQNGKAHKTTAHVLSWPGGTWLVGIVGAIIIGVGLWNAYRGVTKKFEDKWERGRMSDAERRWGARAGVLGHLARAVVFTLIGVFAIKAAVDYNPKESIGLDGALQKLAHQSYGSWLLGLTAAGLICYAVYCFADARYRDVSANGGGSSRSSGGGGNGLYERVRTASSGR